MLYTILENWEYPNGETGHYLCHTLYANKEQAKEVCHNFAKDELSDYISNCGEDYKLEFADNCATIIQDEMNPKWFYIAEIVEFTSVEL